MAPESDMTLYSLENLDEEEIGSALDRAFAREELDPESPGEPLVTLELTAADLATEAAADSDPIWHLGIGEPPLGPVSRQAVRELWSRGEITADTPCWRTGFADWQPIWRVKELASVALEERTLNALRTLEEEPLTPAGLKGQLSALAQGEMSQLAREPEVPAAVEEAYVAQAGEGIVMGATPDPALLPARESVQGMVPRLELRAASLPPAFVALVAVGATVALMLCGVLLVLLLRPGAGAGRVSPAAVKREKSGAPVAAPRGLPARANVAAEVQPRTLRTVVLDGAPAPDMLPPISAKESPGLEKKPSVAAAPAPSADAEFENTFGEPPEGKPTPPKRSSAGATLPESLSQGDVFAVVLAHKAGVEVCVAEQRRRAGSEGGAVVMRWSIHPDGKVSDIKPAQEDPSDAAFASCLAAQMKSWTFPRHTAQGEPVEFPFRY